MKLFKKTLIVLLFAMVSTVAFTGCRTAHGFGEDMENTGQDIQQKTN